MCRSAYNETASFIRVFGHDIHVIDIAPSKIESQPDEATISPEVQATLDIGFLIMQETELVLDQSYDLTGISPSSYSAERDDRLTVSPSPPPIRKVSTADEDDTEILTRLGTKLHTKGDGYVDASRLNLPPSPGFQQQSRGGQLTFFPQKLVNMLDQLELEGRTSIATFLPHGRAFIIWDKERFAKEVLPLHFKNMHRYDSFARQLQLWGFQRVTSGIDEGAYYHSLFLKGRPELCRFMTRVGKPRGNDRRRKSYRANMGGAAADPNFYLLPPVASQTHMQTPQESQEGIFSFGQW